MLSAEHVVDDDQLELAGPSGRIVRLHEVNTLMSGVNLRVRYGLSEWVLPEISVPVRRVAIEPFFEDQDGTRIDDTESIHHRKETLSGLGDVKLTAAFPLHIDVEGLRLTLRVGSTLPTGSVEPDPGVLGAEGKSHQHIFFGSGTFDPVFGVEAALRTGSLLLTGQVQGRSPALYAAEHDYRQGGRGSASLGAHWILGAWRFGVHPGMYFETPSKWGSSPALNSGRLDALASGSVGYAPTDPLIPSLTLSLGRPINIETDGGQFNTAFSGSLSASWLLGGSS